MLRREKVDAAWMDGWMDGCINEWMSGSLKESVLAAIRKKAGLQATDAGSCECDVDFP